MVGALSLKRQQPDVAAPILHRRHWPNFHFALQRAARSRNSPSCKRLHLSLHRERRHAPQPIVRTQRGQAPIPPELPGHLSELPAQLRRASSSTFTSCTRPRIAHRRTLELSGGPKQPPSKPSHLGPPGPPSLTSPPPQHPETNPPPTSQAALLFPIPTRGPIDLSGPPPPIPNTSPWHQKPQAATT